MTSTALIYVRKSTVSEGRSLREQESDLRALAERLGLAVVGVVAEEASAYAERERPKFTAALRRCEAEGLVLLCWALDRFSRQGAEAVLPLLPRRGRAGVRLVTLDGVDTADSSRRLDVIVRAELALQESERISARVTRAKTADRAAGRWLSGPPPYGYVTGADRRLRPHAEQGPVVRRIVNSILAGRTLLAIARELNAENVPAPGGWRKGGGREWTTGHLSAMLKNPALVGWLPSESGSETAEVDGDGEPISVMADGAVPIVTPAERAQARAILAGRTRPGGGPAGRQARSLLAGKVFCGRCEGPLTSHGADYRCQSRKNGGACAGTTVLRERLDRYVAERTAAGLRRLAVDWLEHGEDHFVTPPDARATLEALGALWGALEAPEAPVQRREAERAVEDAQEALGRVDDAFADGRLDGERHARQVERIVARLAAARANLETISPTPALSADAVAGRILSGDLGDPEGQVRVAVSRVVVRPAGKRGGRFDGARVSVFLAGGRIVV